MAIRLNRVANRLASRFLESDLVKSVADFLRDLDLSEIDLGEVFDNISLEDWTDDLRSGLESAIDTFSKDFNFTKLVENIDDLFGGVDLSDINFDALLKDVLGDISLNRLVKDLDQLLGSVEVEDLFKDSIDTLDWSDLAKRVRAIASEVFDDFSTGLAQLNLGDRTANLLRGSNVSNILSGLGGSDRLLGLGGADILLGGNGNDELLGGAGADVLFGGLGRSLLTGGVGSDLFALTAGRGFATITDYRSGVDALTVLGDVAVESLKLRQRGADAVIRYGPDVLAVLTGVDVRTLGLSDFV
ncbi:calcium-binding protein [Thermoleptolyngbya sp.]